MSGNNNPLRQLTPPGPRARVLFGGTALVMSIFALSWYALDKYHIRKDARNAGNPGAIPTWEYRMWQARFPEDGTSKPATLRTHEGTSDPSHTPPPPSPGAHYTHPEGYSGDESSLERAYKAVPEALAESKAGKSTDPEAHPRPGPEPTPQRTDPEEERVYTKATKSYLDPYEKRKEKGKA
ncbi:hypothetical protein ID866_6125 [Astraeus odoratus]|nr:hypothetical protein ID866_6125 [Astraeus odoratus]